MKRQVFLAFVFYAVGATAGVSVKVTNQSEYNLRVNASDQTTSQSLVVEPYATKAVPCSFAPRQKNECVLHLQYADRPDSLNEREVVTLTLATAHKKLRLPLNTFYAVGGLKPTAVPWGVRHYPLSVGFASLSLYSRSWYSGRDINYHFVLQENTPQSPVSIDPNHLRVLTYNVKLDPYYFSFETPLNHAQRRAHILPRYLKNYDALVVEELFASHMRNEIIEALSHEYRYHTSDIKGNKALTGGVVIFSRWPLTYQQQMVFSHCSKEDCHAAKGVVYAQINKYDQKYHIFGTHLQAGDAPVRNEQLTELANFIDSQMLPSGARVLVAGDFNIDVNQSANVDLLKQTVHVFPTSVAPVSLLYSCDITNTMTNHKTQKRLDFIFPVIEAPTSFVANGTTRASYGVPSQSWNRVRVFRDFDNRFLWEVFDLSDHYAVEGEFSY